MSDIMDSEEADNISDSEIFVVIENESDNDDGGDTLINSDSQAEQQVVLYPHQDSGTDMIVTEENSEHKCETSQPVRHSKLADIDAESSRGLPENCAVQDVMQGCDLASKMKPVCNSEARVSISTRERKLADDLLLSASALSAITVSSASHDISVSVEETVKSVENISSSLSHESASDPGHLESSSDHVVSDDALVEGKEMLAPSGKELSLPNPDISAESNLNSSDCALVDASYGVLPAHCNASGKIGSCLGEKRVSDETQLNEKPPKQQKIQLDNNINKSNIQSSGKLPSSAAVETLSLPPPPTTSVSTASKMRMKMEAVGSAPTSMGLMQRKGGLSERMGMKASTGSDTKAVSSFKDSKIVTGISKAASEESAMNAKTGSKLAEKHEGKSIEAIGTNHLHGRMEPSKSHYSVAPCAGSQIGRGYPHTVEKLLPGRNRMWQSGKKIDSSSYYLKNTRARP